MKMLLVSPERQRKKEEAFLFRLSFLNLPSIAAVTPPDVEVSIVDEAFDRVNFEDTVDLVGITAQTPVAPRAYQIAEEYKKRGIPVVMGGAHASMLPDEAFLLSYAAVGAAELLLNGNMLTVKGPKNAVVRDLVITSQGIAYQKVESEQPPAPRKPKPATAATPTPPPSQAQQQPQQQPAADGRPAGTRSTGGTAVCALGVHRSFLNKRNGTAVSCARPVRDAP